MMAQAFPEDGGREAFDADKLIDEAYSDACERLIARAHRQEEVEAMPPAQALLTDVAETFEELRDEYFKWSHVPYWEAGERSKPIEELLGGEGRGGEVVPLAAVFLPAVSKASLAVARNERDLDALRCIEAVRLYAAGHGGKLPKSLGEISEVPIPLNPVTGRAFGYRLDGVTAILDADGPEGTPQRQYRLRVGGK